MQKNNPHRATVVLVSSGGAPGPVSAVSQDMHTVFAM
ncbi:hypothetical protein A2U01_0078917, partial [Trifolium medium]|nr:hypothetical protein [Trifolium medium]